ncbi:hypothetical protein AB6A40_009264 [Gnathostoma spinigerum]|uniref:Peptidase S54 rhomboid domain-containing protein n=1 Tax=Gnathostoma spinigerum TaxID=75299 RepID=A0ABD6ESN1_9BILA
MQTLVGIPLEMVHKVWRIAVIYLTAVVFGALLQYVADPSVYLVGCSAGVYSLIFAHFANVVINWAEMPYRIVRLCVLVLYVTLDVGFAVHRRLQSNTCDRVSYTSHIAGAVTGLTLGIALLYNIKEHQFEKIIKYLCIATFFGALLFCITMTIFKSPFSAPIFDVNRCYEESNL